MSDGESSGDDLYGGSEEDAEVQESVDSYLCDCGFQSSASCAKCLQRLCMIQCGTMTNDVCFCEGCDDQGEESEGEVHVAKTRRIMSSPSVPQGSFTQSNYSDRVRVYKSRAEAMKSLGSGTRCKSHAARVAKTLGECTF